MSIAKTPKKAEEISGFIPLICICLLSNIIQNLQIYNFILVPKSPAASPQKKLTGLPRIVQDVAADLYNHIQKWNDFHIQGSHLVNQIALVKSNSFESYSAELEQLTDNLYKVLQNLEPYVQKFEKFQNQIEALNKLQNATEVLFISCSVDEIKQITKLISAAYLKEYKVS